MATQTLSYLDAATIGIHPPAFRLPVTARVGRVRLAVSELTRSIDFYTRVIGLTLLGIQGNLARLGTKTDTTQTVLLELEKLPGVSPLGASKRLGLYHTAFLLPTRESLASFVQHLNEVRVPFGSSDHLVSEALYLTDPDGLAVEVYADRPRSEWNLEGREIVLATNPLRFGTLPAVAPDSWHGAPAGTTIGHVHLYIGDLKQAANFYHHTLGFDIVTWRYPGALFLSAGGYHHHVGLNVWAAGSPIASTTDARLLYWELLLPNQQEIDRIATNLTSAGFTPVASPGSLIAFTDPWGITVALSVDQPAA